MSSSQFNKGPSYGLSAEVKNRVSGAGGGGMPGPAGVCQRRSPGGVPRVPMPSGGCGAGSRGAGGAGAALRSWGALTLPRGAPRGLGGVLGTGRPHSLPGPIPCGVSGAMAPAPCSSAPEVSLLSAFPPLCVPRGAAPNPILSLVDSRARTGPCCGTGRGQGNLVTLLGLFALKEDAGCCREGCIPTLRAGLGAPGWVHSPGCAPFLLWEWSSAMGGCSGPLPFPVHHCSPCSTGMGSAVGCPTQDGCGMRTRLGLGSPSRPHRIWVSSPCEDGPLLAPGGWTRAGASPLPAPRCFSLVQQELSQSDGPAVQAAR